MNGRHITSGMQGRVYSTREYCDNGNSFADITADAVQLFVRMITKLDN